MKKIILFELNEVPFFIIDDYINKHPKSALAKLAANSYQYETFTEDSVPLSPWITWPTLHRGVTSQDHYIADFGQELSEVDAAYPPIWKILSNNNVNTAVCGSLHSYPVPTNVSDYSFYLPDTFAEKSNAYPKDLESFQQFNLAMARQSARNVANKIAWKDALAMLTALPKLGIKANTIKEILAQLSLERLKPHRINRRRMYQSVLAFDVFYKKLKTFKPDFTTFFTNHVASAMHRYWAAAYPEHYSEHNYPNNWLQTYKYEIEFAMHKTDAMLNKLMQFIAKNNDYTLILTSSMGQEATQALWVETQIYLTKPQKLLSHLGIHANDWQLKPAMFPQVNMQLKTEAALKQFKTALLALTIMDKPINFREQTHGFISMDFGHENLHKNLTHLNLKGAAVPLTDLGFEFVEIKDKSGTSAYHIANGSLFIYPNKSLQSAPTRPQISSIALTPSILKQFNVKIPHYMSNQSIF